MSLILSGTDGLSDVDGTAATPAIRGTDANTGIFFPAADTIAFAEGGAEVARFDSSGNFGIGTASPATKLHVVGSGNPTITLAGSDGAYSSIFNMNSSSGGVSEIAASQVLKLSTNGSERARIDSSGNLGLGVTPSAWGSSYKAMQLGSLGAAGISIAGNDASIGTNYYLNTSNNITYATNDRIAYLSMYSGEFRFYNSPTGTANTTATLTQRLILDTSGRLSTTGASTFGATINVQELSDAAVVLNAWAGTSSYTGNIIYSFTNSSGTGFNFYQCNSFTGLQFKVRGDGTVYAQNTTIQSASDVRIKENIVNSTDGLNVITALRTVRFDFKEGFGNNRKNQLGFIAQEIEQIFPDAVDIWGESDDPEDPYKSVGPSALIPVLVKAIQEQQAIITTLTARITALESA